MRSLSPRFEATDLADPVPGAGEVCVRMQAVALTPFDVAMAPLGERVPGGEGAGVVESVGAGVADVRPGDAVAIGAAIGCGSCGECVAGREDRCARPSDLGGTRNGTLADFCVVPARHAIPLPAGFHAEECASAGRTFSAAWRILKEDVALAPGQTMVVLECGGFAGAAIQVGVILGARVIAVANDEADRASARVLGASEVHPLDGGAFKNAVMKATAKRGADAIIAPVVGDFGVRSVAALARGGSLVPVPTGKSCAPDLVLPVGALAERCGSVHARFTGRLGDLHALMPFFERGQLKPQVGSLHRLGDVARAVRAERFGAGFSDVVVTLEEEGP